MIKHSHIMYDDVIINFSMILNIPLPDPMWSECLDDVIILSSTWQLQRKETQIVAFESSLNFLFTSTNLQSFTTCFESKCN